jgi:hypothetical protein
MKKNPEARETQPPRRSRRYWMRSEQAQLPFVWSGLLPLVGLACLILYAVLPFAREEIQAAVHDNTRATLDAAGLQWVELSVSGQNVELSGTLPAARGGRSESSARRESKGKPESKSVDDADGDRAVMVARQATCPSWAGRLVCAVSVTARFTH